MKQYVLVAIAAIAWFGHAQAAPPTWCKGATFEFGDYELRELQRKTDPDRTMQALVKATCSGSPAAEAHKAEIDAARASWGKKFGLAEDDWAEVVAYAQDSSHNLFRAEFSTKDITKFTPVDQYRLIAKGWADDSRDPEPMYYTDIVERSLTEAGRVAFLGWCLDRSIHGDEDDATKWAVCQGDIDRFDPAGLFQELHADPHDGSAKFLIRLRGVALVDKLKDYSEAKARLIKKDDEYGKLFEVAAKGRAEWAKLVGTNTQLLDLVLQMDAANGFHSRKLLDGCEARTAEALAAAVSQIPAKEFSGMSDVRDDPYGGFAHRARDVLARRPQVSVAAIAYAECQPTTGIGKYAAYLIAGTPTARGPRSYALTTIMGTEFKFDDVKKGKLSLPDFRTRPYPGGDQVGSAGGVVKSVKAGDKDMVTVGLEKLIIMQEDCMKSHDTGRITRLRPDGSLEYESICDKWQTVPHDHSWGEFKINPAHAKLLKPGVLFSATYGHSPSDVLATWASKNAKLPSTVLGATVK